MFAQDRPHVCGISVPGTLAEDCRDPPFTQPSTAPQEGERVIYDVFGMIET
jgi:hypothetical protein